MKNIQRIQYRVLFIFKYTHTHFHYKWCISTGQIYSWYIADIEITEVNIVLDKMKEELDQSTDTMTQGMSAFVRVQILIF